MHTCAFHMELKACHRHRDVTSTGTWSCMRGWHRPTLNSQMEFHHGIYAFLFLGEYGFLEDLMLCYLCIVVCN
uniref:Uncharacterized protein n=1 Tax=Arundo donax TaxID=35708 RepID=A0A0A9CCE0_ARUDO